MLVHVVTVEESSGGEPFFSVVGIGKTKQAAKQIIEVDRQTERRGMSLDAYDIWLESISD